MTIDQKTSRIMRRAREIEEHAREIYTRAVTAPEEVDLAGRSNPGEIHTRSEYLARAAWTQARVWAVIASEES